MAAGLAAAVAAKSSRCRIRCVAGIDLDLLSGVLTVDSSLSSCSSSSLAVCISVSNVQENIFVPDLAPKDPKSILGYIEAAPESVVAADLAAAVAAKSSRCRIRCVAGIDLDLPSEVLDVDSSLSSCSSSSLAVCIPVSNVQENIVVPALAPVVSSSFSAPKLGNVYIFHFN